MSLKLIAGLGNPGDEYARTRHNAGFWLVDELARRHGGKWRFEGRHEAELARVKLGVDELWLIKPMNYMNRSGGPVASVAHFYKFEVDALLVAHDEIDLPVGTVRLKAGGGHGGHNGLRDMMAQLGEGFWRLRLGVGHPGAKTEVIDYVLTRAPAAEDRLIHEAVLAAADIVPVMLAQGAQKAMNILHTRPEAPQADR